MTNKQTITVLAAVAALALATGWLTAPGPAPPSNPPEAGPPPSAAAPSTRDSETFLAALDSAADTPPDEFYRQLANLAATATKSQLRARFFAVVKAKHLDSLTREHAASLLVGRLASLDLDAAFALARESATSATYFLRPHAFEDALPGISGDGAATALFDLILVKPDVSVAQATGYLRTVAAGDAPAVIAALLEDGRTEIAHNLEKHHFVNLARTDPQRALAEINTLPLNRRGYLVSNFHQKWAEHDPPAAWRSALADPAMATDSHGLGRLLVTWVKKDPAAAIAASTPEVLRKLDYSVSEVGKTYAELNPTAALAWTRDTAAEFGMRYKEHLYRGLVSGLAKSDPEAAKRFIMDIPDLPGRKNLGLLDTFVDAYTTRSPAEAAAWIATLPPEYRGPATAAAIDRLDYQDPDTAFAMLEDPSLSTDDLVAALNNAADNLAKEDFTRFLETAARVPADQIAGVLGRSLRSLGRENRVDDAIAIIETVGYDDDQIISQAQQFVGGWAKNDPIATSTWVAGLPEGELRDYAHLNLIDAWARVDPVAATAWIDSLPPSRSRDHAAVAAAARLVTYDKPAALRWLAEVEDDKIRNRFYSDGALHLTPEDLDTLHQGGLVNDSSYERYGKELASEQALLDHLRSSN